MKMTNHYISQSGKCDEHSWQ